MEWLLVGIAVLVLGAGAVVASGRLGEMPDAVRDAPLPVLPPGPLDAEDLRRISFEVVPLGYSTAQVDAVLARLRAQLATGAPPAPGGEASGSSAIMAPHEFSRNAERENDGSNEAPHG